MTDIALGAADNGRTLQVKPGDTITIRLPENPTTGYRWQTVPSGVVLRQTSSRYIPPGEGAAGAGGEREITFAVEVVGETRLRLLYKQPWLANESAAELIEIIVKAYP